MKHGRWGKWLDDYALLPTFLICGRIVWLRRIQSRKRWNINMNQWGDFNGHGGADGGWEYESRATPPPPAEGSK
jgi:hypothetical protein